MIDKIKEINSKYNISTSMLLILTMVSVNFTSYLYYYDLNILAIIDTDTIIKFTLMILFPFALISSLVSMVLIIFKSMFTTSLEVKKIWLFNRLNNKEFISFINSGIKEFYSKLEYYSNHFILKIILSFLFFSIFYIGFLYTIILLILVVFYFLLISVFFRFLGIQRFLIINIISFNVNSENFNFFKSLVSYIGILIILTSFLLGLFRAIYIENKPFVIIENKSYSLILTTSNGIVLFEPEERISMFKNWQDLDKMKFNNEFNRSWNNVKSIKDDIEYDIEKIKAFIKKI